MFLLLAFFISSLPHLNFTGAVIGELSLNQSIFNFVALAFFIISAFLFLSRKSLDAIVIPSGTWEADIDRAGKALSEKDKLKDNGYFVISGYKGEGFEGMRRGQSYRIYKYLRDHDVLPKDIRVEGKSHDSEENVLYTLKKMKEMEEKRGREKPIDIAFVSSPSHLQRFQDFYEEAVRRGLVDKKDFRFHEIKTEGFGEEPGYENSLPRKLIHEYKLRTIGRYEAKKGGIKYNEKPDFVISLIRNLEKIKKKIRGIKNSIYFGV